MRSSRKSTAPTRTRTLEARRRVTIASTEVISREDAGEPRIYGGCRLLSITVAEWDVELELDHWNPLIYRLLGRRLADESLGQIKAC
jgi:hypothetical protein